ncbi:HTH-type transcriptional repressor of iron proteins A [Vibrio spartinae]|uniref:HTH-type transcriptional repressor of iron proteins A n=2 Tax=Vibrio spartinae TaxID=1918945 RepID=A0A1N6M7X3_9VIBR|nr:HTH-type transcriptional repressor of iron proteins A [Vibrio spartinae]SIO95460.1 HTH-type transcriptional repressor of iron proteins A [Vibrio spartinae]
MTQKDLKMPKNISKATLLPPSQFAYTIDPSRPVLTHSRSMLAETRMTPHSHPRGQLLWAAQGIVKVTSDAAIWIVPSTHAVWIPGGVVHQVQSETVTHMRNLYVDPSFPIRAQQKGIAMLKMTPLIRELVLRLVEGHDSLQEGPMKRLGLVLIDEIATLDELKVYLPAGKDPRLNRLITHIINEPLHHITLQQRAAQVGASVRTIERLFKAETGMTYRQWCSRHRLISTLELLRQGESTNRVAYELGYKSVSSFISAFKTLFGCTPQAYAQRENHQLPPI